jgi:hypothetical protein
MSFSIPLFENPLRVFANVLTNVGKQIVTGRLLSNTLPSSPTPGHAPPIYVGWGSGSGTSAIGDTTLFTEEAEARTAGTPSQVTTGGGTTNDTLQVQGTVTAVGPKTITNAGLFDVAKAQGAGATGNLFAKGDFTGVVLATGDSIAFTFRWQLQ